jgi:hypothetical protein
VSLFVVPPAPRVEADAGLGATVTVVVAPPPSSPVDAQTGLGTP